MKKIFSLFLIVALIFGLSATAFAADFVDTIEVPQSEAIDVIETLGIVEGFGENVYGPHDVLTRAQLCTMLTRALYGAPVYTSAVEFEDVDPMHWAHAYINTAYVYGLMVGYGDGKFGPEDEITYTQMAAVIMKALGYDCNKMVWPAGVNAMAHTLDLFNNVAFSAYEDGCTRAHAAQMIYNAFDLNFVNHKGDYPVTVKNKTFLADGLGFSRIENGMYKNGHIYEAYTNGKEIFITNNRLTSEMVIYPTADGYAYYFRGSNRTYSISWYSDINVNGTVLYVNGIPVNNDKVNEVFAAAAQAVGVFDANKSLIAVYVESTGVNYIYALGDDATIIELIPEKDMPVNVNDMTVTYFAESGRYVISTSVGYGWVTESYKNSIVVNNMTLTYMGVRFAETASKGDFVKLYYNYRDEVVAVEVIDKATIYDMTAGIYHTAECPVWNNIVGHHWHSSANNMTCELCTENMYTFIACEYCQAANHPVHKGAPFTVQIVK